MIKIFIIHPDDKSTSFLNRIKNHLRKNFNSDLHHFNIKPNEGSHSKCLEEISKLPVESLIIFLGHGRSDSLYGAKGKLAGYLENDIIKAEDSQAYYENDTFITESNFGSFKDKKVFCLSCRSNEKLAEFAAINKTKVFFSFGNIPTSLEEFQGDSRYVGYNSDFVKMAKTELNFIMKVSLAKSIKEGKTFDDLYNLIKFLCNQRITYYLKTRKNLKERFLISDYLNHFKNEIKIIGDRYALLIG